MKFFLVIANGRRLGLPIHIDVDLFLLGSTRMCQLRSPALAPKHCALVTRDDKVFLRDFDGGKPTFLNEEPIPPGSECRLHAGDLLGVGPLEFIVEFREVELSQADEEEWSAQSLDDTMVDNVLEEVEYSRRIDTAQQAAAQILDQLTVIKGVVKGRLRLARQQGILIVHFNDDMIVDPAEIDQIQRELRESLRAPNQRIVLDFKNVDRLSSGGVVMIRDLQNWLGAFGSKLSICRVRPDILAMISTLIPTPITIFPDRRSALAGKW
jgi:anti-anti-sigma regulatory factor